MNYVACIVLCGSLSLVGDGQKPLEIEIKFKALQEEVDRLRHALPLPCKEIAMHELYVFGKNLQPVCEKDYTTMTSYLRLRSTPKGSFITFKERSSGEVIEYECRLDDSAMMDRILQALGYGALAQDRVVLKKKRSVYLTAFEGHAIEVVFDTFEQPEHMKEMGEFVEIELKSSTMTYNDGIALLERFLTMHGIHKIVVYAPYIELALNPDVIRCKERVLMRGA